MKLSIQLGIFSAASIGLAFASQWYVLTILGPGAETDALFAGMTIPQLVLMVVSGSLMHVLVPLLAGETEEDLARNAWVFLALIGGLFTILAALLYVAAPWWVPLTVPGFSPSSQALTVMLTRVQLVGMVFAAINGVQWAAYHARQRFLWAEFTPFLASALTLVLLIWALPRYGIVSAAWIATLRMALQTAMLAPGMGRPTRPDLTSPAVSEAWKRIKPLLLGSAYYKTDPLVDRFMLSSANSGSLSLYYLVQQIYGAVSQVINKAIAAPLVPMLTTFHKAGDSDGFWSLYQRKFLQVGALGISGVAFIVIAGKPILGLLIGHGHFTTDNVGLLWLLMILMSGQFVIGNLGVIMTSMFYSVSDTRSPTVAGSIAYTLGIPIRIAMFYFFGVTGLAIAVSVYYVISFVLMFRQVRIAHYAYAHAASS